MGWALGLWVGSALLDVLVAPFVDDVSPGFLLVVKALGLVWLGCWLQPLRRRDLISRTWFRAARIATFGGAAVVVGLLAHGSHGLTSPFLLGLVCVMTVQATTAPRPVRIGAVRLLGTAVVGIATTVGGAALTPGLRGQFADHDARVTFAINVILVGTALVLLVIGSAATWALRRQVFAQRVIGRYRLIEKLAEGGMGEVWRARHPGLQRDVAVKILRIDPHARDAALLVTRFDAEARALAELTHPNTVRVYDSGVTDDGLCFYAMELLRGETLAQRIGRTGPATIEQASTWARQLAGALAEAHDLGLIHRDLSPRNVFLCDDGNGTERAKLIDFGIVQRTADLAPAVASPGDAVVGTPAYMSPEQVLGEPLTPATDIYALGAVWYFALVGAPPFDDTHSAATMLERVAGDVPRARSLRPAVPLAIDEVIARCMARTVGARFDSMRRVLEALGAAGVAPITRKRRAASAADLDGIPAAAVVTLGSHGHAGASGPAGEDYERLADLGRLRTMLGWGGAIWATTVAVDLLITSTSTGAGLAYLLPVRLAPTVVAFGVWYGLRRAGAAGVRYVTLARAVAVTSTAVATALISLGWGGLESPMVGGLSCLLIAEGLAFPARMGAMLRRLAWSTGLFVATILGGVALSAELRPQLAAPHAWALFGLNLGSVVLVAVLVAAAGDASSQLRRQLFVQRAVGRYRLTRLLGAGAMGEVWAANHPGLRREVAVKVLRPTETSTVMAERFEAEIAALSGINEPHVVRIHDCGVTDDGLCYYVMEKLAGHTASAEVRASGPLPPRRALAIAEQVARALVGVHAAGIVHRDLKPDNVMLTIVGDDHDYVKVIDFGIARSAASRPDLTQAGTIVGTPAFMAPEQALGQPVEARADVYALGATLYYMLTGRPPFVASSATILLMSQIHDPALPPSVLVPELAPAIDELVLRCLAKDPSDRFASMDDLGEALAVARAALDAPVPPRGGAATTRVPAATPTDA